MSILSARSPRPIRSGHRSLAWTASGLVGRFLRAVGARNSTSLPHGGAVRQLVVGKRPRIVRRQTNSAGHSTRPERRACSIV
ncbi:hypothetical protein ACFFQF_30280 [Haladaptatus pallidirubidus]